jgi:hypothetical protein
MNRKLTEASETKPHKNNPEKENRGITLSRRSQLRSIAATGVGIGAVTSFVNEAKAASTINVPNDYSSIQTAVNEASAGDTINVSEGKYRENIIIPKPINLIGDYEEGQMGATDQSPVISGNETGPSGIRIYPDVSDVSIRGFKITGFSDGIMALNDLSDITIQYNTVKNVKGQGVFFGARSDSNNNNINILDNIIDGFHKAGISLVNSEDSIIRNNVIHGQDGEATFSGSKSATGIELSARKVGDVETSIKNCQVDNNKLTGPFIFSGIGVRAWKSEDLNVTLSDIKISDNEIKDTINSNWTIKIQTWGSATQLTNVDVRQNNLTNGSKGIALINFAEPGEINDVSIVANTLENNSEGIIVNEIANNVSIRRNDISKYDTVGLVLRDGTNAGTIDVHSNNLRDVDSVGLHNYGEGELDASCNWWGSKNGPKRKEGKSGKVVGDGSRVKGSIHVKPWLAKRFEEAKKNCE